MRYSAEAPCLALLLILGTLALRAQAPDYSQVGRTPTRQEIEAWDITIGIDGSELPAGKGTARQGAPIYQARCASCHGPNLEGTSRGKVLVGGRGTLTTDRPNETVGSYWAFATSIWDYIHRAMPLFQEETLSAPEVYALTAYLLYRNDIIGEDEVMDARSLPRVRMPNRDGFIPRRVEDIPDVQKRGCRFGHCP